MAASPDRPEVFEARSKADRSTAALLSDLATETIELLRQEIALFKAELHEKLSRVGQGATALTAGTLIVYSGWLTLLAAATLGLSEAVAPWLAALIVGLLVLAVGAGLLWFG